MARWSYDANGRALSSTDRENQTTTYEYDPMARLLKETNPMHHAETYTYDKAGNRLTVTDRNRNTTTYAYDGLNRLVSTTDPEGAISETAYDYLGNVSALTTWGRGEAKSTTRYAYDGAGFLTSETSPLGYITTYQNDKEGNPLKKTDRDGKVTQFEYDALNRLAKRTDADGVSAYTYMDLYRERKEKIKRMFADAKEKYAMRYTRYRGLRQVTNWVRLKFAAMNLKKLARWKWLDCLQPLFYYALLIKTRILE